MYRLAPTSATASRDTAQLPQQCVLLSPFLRPPGVLDFHDQRIRLEVPAPRFAVAERALQIVVIDNEQITSRAERPSHTRVRAHRVALVVILNEAAQLQVGREFELQPA